MVQEQSTTDASSTDATKGELQARSRDVPYYVKELLDIPEAAREVLEKYSNIPHEQVHNHIYQVVRLSDLLIPSRCVSDETKPERKGLGRLALSMPWRMAISGSQLAHNASVLGSARKAAEWRKAIGFGLLLWTRTPPSYLRWCSSG